MLFVTKYRQRCPPLKPLGYNMRGEVLPSERPKESKSKEKGEVLRGPRGAHPKPVRRRRISLPEMQTSFWKSRGLSAEIVSGGCQHRRERGGATSSSHSGDLLRRLECGMAASQSGTGARLPEARRGYPTPESPHKWKGE